MTEALLSASEAAKRLGVCRTTIYAWVAAGKLSCFRFPGVRRDTLRFLPSHVDDFLQSCLELREGS